MSSLPRLDENRIAIYARVSSEEQAERGTVQGQLDFLRNFAKLYNFDIVGEYVDDGISGVIPLSQRPEGRRLLEDAQAGCFRTVVVYKLDRLGRSLTSILTAFEQLEAAEVSIRSGMEPFDTITPFGRFMFQFLGSLAELERSTITERMTMGKNRVAREGKWTTGPVPFGYDLDADDRLIPSARYIEAAGQTEAELARSVFERIAAGSTTIAECSRLNALGVPTSRRYRNGTTIAVAEQWLPSRIAKMIKNRVYVGTHVYNQRKNTTIERSVPALVRQDVWDAAQTQLTRNRKFSARSDAARYLIRGLIRCGDCDFGYTGAQHTRQNGRQIRYYRCGERFKRTGKINLGPACQSKDIQADWIENEVWQDCREWILNPDHALSEAQRQIRDRLSQASRQEGERRQLQQALVEKEAEKDRVMILFRRGRMTLGDAEAQLDAIGRETAGIRALLDGIRAQQDLAAAMEAQMVEAATLLASLRDRVLEIEKTNDWDTKRRVVETLVTEVVIRTSGQGRQKQAKADITYCFTKPRSVAVATIS